MPKITHRMSYTRLYRIWADMKNRCLNPNLSKYRRYGGRGIQVCDEWLNDFQAFCDWSMANGYREDLTIDRIDNDGNYCPENCRWATQTVQQNNKSSNHLLTYDGQTFTITEWATRMNIHKDTLMDRIYKHGWSIEKAFTTPVKLHKTYEKRSN